MIARNMNLGNGKEVFRGECFLEKRDCSIPKFIELQENIYYAKIRSGGLDGSLLPLLNIYHDTTEYDSLLAIRFAAIEILYVSLDEEEFGDYNIRANILFNLKDYPGDREIKTKLSNLISDGKMNITFRPNFTTFDIYHRELPSNIAEETFYRYADDWADLVNYFADYK